MRLNRNYIFFALSVCFFSACKTDVKDNTKSSLHNFQLEEDARLGENYSGDYYSICIDSVANLYDINSPYNLIQDTVLKRGDSFQLVDSLKMQENLIPIQFTNGKFYYLSDLTGYFQQEIEGMRYPLFGIVTQENSFVNYFNPNTKLYEKMNLKKGDSYLYVLAKDNPYINIHLEELNDFITVEYCCPVNIIQANDHFAIMKKYRSRMKTILGL